MLEKSSNGMPEEEETMFSIKTLATSPVSVKQIRDAKQRRDALLSFAIKKSKYFSQGHKANNH